jgi:AcrR family transcriptional regulator
MQPRDPAADALPASFRRMWEPPADAPQRKRGLHRERVVAAAIELADADGLAAVSMARVAERLGFTTMSLYRHVSGKDELLMLMLDAGIGPPPGPPAEPGWRAGIEAWAWAMLATLRRHPWGTQIPIPGPLMTPNQLGWLDRGLAAFAGTGLTEAEKAEVVLLVNGYVFWAARLFEDLARAAAAQPGTATAAGGTSAALLTLIGPDRWPALRQALAAGIFDDDTGGAEDQGRDFDFGLQRVLDGIERLVELRSTSS